MNTKWRNILASGNTTIEYAKTIEIDEIKKDIERMEYQFINATNETIKMLCENSIMKLNNKIATIINEGV